jgi:(E)-4-hydroxy-3-methylbut-2-enyl-diphosphate synthase
MTRKHTKTVMVKDIPIGGSNPIVIQTMTTSKTKDINRTIHQINTLATAGSQIVRLAVLDETDAHALKDIIRQTNVPLVADIHFNYKLALIAAEAGIHKIRINPGNIGDESRVKAVIDACKKHQIPIRIGINAGSLEKHIEATYGNTAKAMLESAKYHVSLLEKYDFKDIIISLKSSDVLKTIQAYNLASETFDYPLHLGITEAGSLHSGTIKSSVGLGILLYQGIGDTIRVSLSTDPIEEIKVAKSLLASLNLYIKPNLISCPTCGRLQYDMFPLVKQVEDYLDTLDTDITVAIMGCAVNGPGEARGADVGIAGGKDEGLLFIKGKIVKKVPQDALFETLKEAIDSIIKEKE